MKLRTPRLVWNMGLLFYIFLFCWLGFYLFPSADDYGFYSLLRDKGLWAGTEYYFTTWTGRWSNTFLILSASVIKNNWLPAISAALNLCFLFLLLSEADRKLPVSDRVTLALLLQAAWLSFTPALNETFYWLSGMPHTWTAAFFLGVVFLLARTLRLRKRGPSFFLLGFLAFFNGMILESTCVAQIVLSFFLTLHFLSRKDKFAARTVGMVFLVSVAAFFAMYFAPGTAARMAAGAGGGGKIFRALGVAALFGGITALKFFTKPILYVFLLFLPDIAEKAAPFDKNFSTRLRAWHIFALVCLAAPFQQVIAGWALGEGLPSRGESLALWIMAALWLFLWSFGYRNKSVLAHIRSLRLYPWRKGLLILCLLSSQNFIALVKDLPLAPLYAAEQTRREALFLRQKAEGKKEIAVPLLTVQPKLIFFSDMRPSPHDWKNQNYAQYRGVESVVALPASLLRDGQGADSSERDVVIALEEFAGAENDPEIRFMLGEIYDPAFGISEGVSKDAAAAAENYKMAAARGHRHARRRLARFYATGAGTGARSLQNYSYAVFWLLRSQF